MGSFFTSFLGAPYYQATLHVYLLTCIQLTTARMAPKSGDKKPAQPAKKAVAKKSTGGRKKGSKKAVESYKIYIYKVHCARSVCVATPAPGLSL